MLTDEELAKGLKAALDDRASTEAPAPSGMKERVFSRVARSTGISSPTAPTGASNGGAPEPTAAARVFHMLSGGKALLAAIVVGAVALSLHERNGAPPIGAHSASEPAPMAPAEHTIGAPSSPDVPLAVVSIDALPGVSELPRPQAAPRRSPPPPASGAARDAKDSDTLLAEGAAIERARQAVRRKDAATALEAIDAHAREFPHGALAEERESLRVRVLVMHGRYDEARQAADRFARAYPRSLFQPIVAKAIESIP